MSHNPNLVQLGNVGSNVKDIGNRKGTIGAGIAVRLKSDGTIVTTKADGELLGISVGNDMVVANRTAIAYKGIDIPIRLTDGFTPVLGAVVNIDDVTGYAKAAGTSVTAVNAVFSRLLTDGALLENSSSSVRAACISFPGGL